MRNQESEWFGFEKVDAGDKTGKVLGVFDNVATSYDVMNDAMSLGVHRLWKDKFVRKIRPAKGRHYLDVAGGTGDIAFRIHRKILGDGRITVCDINQSMLSVGRDRGLDNGYFHGLEWVTGNAESLPLPDDSVDVYTIAFGLRNVTRIDDALSEAFRVLRPGGRFYCMEFSRVDNAGLQKLYDAYSFNVIPRLGQMIAKDRDSYQYLVESIRRFPTQEKLVMRMQDAGFKKVSYQNLSFGIAAIHMGIKL